MFELVDSIEKANCITHGAKFHADDVFSTVFLEKLYGNITLIRLKEYQDDGTKLAYDIGLGKFDHHVATYDSKRPNGIHYCSFGLLWQAYGLDYLTQIKVADPKKTFEVFDYLLVNCIDAVDNGEFSITTDYNVYLIDSLIALFRPRFDIKEDEDKSFLEAVSFARIIFDKVLEDSISKVKAINIIKPLIPTIKDKILILPESLPYEFAIFNLNLDVNFVVYPSKRECYAAHTVSTTYKGFTPKIPFKKEWAGLRDNDLVQITGLKTARFCHRNLFLFTADSKEDVIKAIYLTLESK